MNNNSNDERVSRDFGETHFDDRGRPMIEIQGEWYRVHELSYVYNFGPPNDDEEIEQVCGNPLCFNPDHLRAVKRKEDHEDSAN